MAEFVQLRKENWVDALNWLRKLEILRGNELSSVLQEIDKYEYKIQSPNRKLEDILAFVNYLCNLLKYIRERRKILAQFDKTEEVDRHIYNEIGSQFGSAEITFGYNIEFWNARLRFVATVVPEQDRENEFSRVFKKALEYSGRSNLEFYKSCVNFQFSLINLPPTRFPASKKKKKRMKRDCSKIMATVRDITTAALRNMPRSANTVIWVTMTELKYLCILKMEKEKYIDNLPFDYEDQKDKTEKLIQVYYHRIRDTYFSSDPMILCHLFDEVRNICIPYANQLSDEIMNLILSKDPRPLEMSTWLINKSIDDNKIEECVHRINQFLNSSKPKVTVLNISVQKLENFITKLKSTGAPMSCLSKLIQLSISIFDDAKNNEWGGLKSEIFLMSRIQFIKTLKQLTKENAEKDFDEKLITMMKQFLERHPINRVILKSVDQIPSSFFLVKERIELLFRKANKNKLKSKSMKPLIILKYLSGVDWKHVKTDDARSFLNYVYRMFTMTPRLHKKVERFLRLPIKKEVMNELRIRYLRFAYLSDKEVGRKFYSSCLHVSDWELAAAALDIEATFCRNGEPTPYLRRALEDVQRLSGTSTTEPWKVAACNLRTIGQEKEASLLLQRALDKFRTEKTLEDKYKDLLVFKASF